MRVGKSPNCRRDRQVCCASSDLCPVHPGLPVICRLMHVSPEFVGGCCAEENSARICWGTRMAESTKQSTVPLAADASFGLLRAFQNADACSRGENSDLQIGSCECAKQGSAVSSLESKRINVQQGIVRLDSRQQQVPGGSSKGHKIMGASWTGRCANTS